MVEKTVAHFGGLDGIVNNAGINIPRLLVDEGHQYELDEAVWDKVMNVNLKGLFFCAQSAARVLVRQRHGVIVNMSSESGLEGSEGQSVYAASKNAVNSLTRSWAKELGKKGVRVVGVAPGILEATGLRTLSYETALAYTRGITVEQLRAGYSENEHDPDGPQRKTERSGKRRRLHAERPRRLRRRRHPQHRRRQNPRLNRKNHRNKETPAPVGAGASGYLDAQGMKVPMRLEASTMSTSATG